LGKPLGRGTPRCGGLETILFVRTHRESPAKWADAASGVMWKDISVWLGLLEVAGSIGLPEIEATK
jgi:hypothetical protein